MIIRIENNGHCNDGDDDDDNVDQYDGHDDDGGDDDDDSIASLGQVFEERQP